MDSWVAGFEPSISVHSEFFCGFGEHLKDKKINKNKQVK